MKRIATVNGVDPSRVCAELSSGAGPALGYAIEADGRFRWTGESTVTAPALLAAEKEPEPATSLQQAEDFLRQELGRGRVAVKRVLENARLLTISERTLKRAKARLGVISRKGDTENGAWSWEICSS
jgi:hypothetical protein